MGRTRMFTWNPRYPFQVQLRQLLASVMEYLPVLDGWSGRSMGRTRMFTWNPRYPFQVQLRQLLASATEYLPDSEVKAYYRQRRRPRRAGKPL
jgi:Na+-transporting NADH:ubiquinone oxidoreductase subunit NqrB